MERLELKVPPVVVTMFVGFAMWLLTRLVASAAVAIAWNEVLAMAFTVLGAAIGVSGVVSFRRARTTVNPTRPESTSAIVTTGIYRISRNPMYLGLLVVLCGWAIHLSNLCAFALLPVFGLYMNRFQIAPEERALTSLFGEGFRAYSKSVRRWL